jgi:hypothetical protein
MAGVSPPMKNGPIWHQLVDPPRVHKHRNIKGWKNAICDLGKVNSEELPAATFLGNYVKLNISMG